MAKKSISWILEFTSKLPDEEKIKCLRANENTALLTVLQFALRPGIEWALPEGDPPYRPNEYPNQESVLYSEARKLYLFVKGGNDNLKQLKREAMFIELLEIIDPQDAKLLLAAKNKTIPYEGITPEIVSAAFPGLL